MLRSFRNHSHVRPLALWVTALAITMKLLIAPGTMPMADRQGISITLCTGAGPVETKLDVGGQRHHEDGKSAHQPCVFAALSMDAVKDHMVGPEVPLAIAPTASNLPPLLARAPPAHALPPATGPPILA